jgi:hypothetical protein
MNNSKIACFVNNTYDLQTDVGLKKVINDNKLSFCTEFLFTVTGNIVSNEGKLSKEKPYLLISKKLGVKLTDEVPKWDADWDMIWIHDSKKVSDVTKTEDNVNGFLIPSQTFVLYHKKASHRLETVDNENSEDSNFIKDKKFKLSKLGKHECNDEYYYSYLAEIAEIWEKDDTDVGKFDSQKFDEAFKRIKDKIFPEKLEVILGFLHSCLVKAPTDSEYEKLEDVGIEKTALVTELTGDPMMPEYKKSLATLRDKLLKLVIPE